MCHHTSPFSYVFMVYIRRKTINNENHINLWFEFEDDGFVCINRFTRIFIYSVAWSIEKKEKASKWNWDSSKKEIILEPIQTQNREIHDKEGKAK